MSVKSVLLVVLLVASLLFIAQNFETVSVNFLIFSLTMPRALLLSLTLIIGMLIGILLPLGRGRRQK